MPSAVALVNALATLLILVLVVRVIMANVAVLVGRDRMHPLLRTVAEYLFDVTEPILVPIRRILPKGTPIDFSPLVAIIAIDIIARLLTYALLSVL